MFLTFLLLSYAIIISALWGGFGWQLIGKWQLTTSNKVLAAGLDIWLGFAIISLPISILHFFLPIHFGLNLLLILPLFIPALGFKKIAIDRWELYKSLLSKQETLAAFLTAMVCLLLRPGTGDIADYHLQHILWATDYPMVQGLGNFNRPLANNNWWFHLQALFGMQGLNHQSLFIGNGVLFIAAFIWFSITSVTLSRAHQYLRFVFLLFIILTSTTAFVGAVTPDYVITLSLFLLIDLYLREESGQYGSLILVICAWLLTIKATAITFFMLPLPIVWHWIKQKNIAQFIKTSALVLLFLIPWIIGNIWVSGYLLYPFSQIDLFEVDWKMPAWLGEFERFVLKQWGRVPYQDPKITATLAFSAWIKMWFAQLDLMNRLLLIGSILATPIVIWKNYKNPYLLWVILFLLVGFTLLFNNGPHPRFLFAYMVSMIALLAATFGPEKSINLLPEISKKLLFIFFFYLFLFKHASWYLSPENFVYPKAYPKPAVEEKTLNGQVVYITPNNNTCWDQFPCSYYFVDSIALRGSSLSEGFRWQTMPKP